MWEGGFEVIKASKKYRDELTRHIAQNDDYWRQKVELFWLKKGDTNSHFFYASAMTRNKRNRVLKS